VIGVAGYAGAGAPTGIAGGTVEITPAKWVTIATGTGIAPSGMQYAVMPRFRIVDGTMGYGIGIGVSEGAYQSVARYQQDSWNLPNAGADSIKTWNHAWFGNVELSIEERHKDGLTWRIFAGAGRVLNASSYECASHSWSGGMFDTKSAPAPGCDPNQGNIV